MWINPWSYVVSRQAVSDAVTLHPGCVMASVAEMVAAAQLRREVISWRYTLHLTLGGMQEPTAHETYSTSEREVW